MKLNLSKYLFLVSSVTFFSCNNSTKQADIIINYDLLKLYNKPDPRIIYVDFAKTGRCVAFVDSTMPYSAGLEGKLAELSEKPFKTIQVKGYMRTKNLNAKGGFVVDIQDETGKSVSYNLSDVVTTVKTPNEWTEFTLNIPLDKPEVQKPQNIFKIYGWCYNGETIYFDDIEINLE